jgi:hypothetical protein
MADYDDPGWVPAVRLSLPFLLLPGLGLRWMLRRSKIDGLTSLRAIFVRIVSALFILLVPLVFLHPGPSGSSWLVYALSALGLADFLLVRWIVSRPPKATSMETLAGAFRGSFFIGVGLAESAALFGFVCFFIEGKLWLYLLGMAFTLLGLAWIAPTRAAIARGQEKIDAQGSSLSLGKALMQVPPPDFRRR